MKFRREIRELWQQGNNGNHDDICETTPFKLSSINNLEGFVSQSLEKIKTPILIDKDEFDEKDENNTLLRKLDFSSSPCETNDILVKINRDELDPYIINIKKKVVKKKRS